MSKRNTKSKKTKIAAGLTASLGLSAIGTGVAIVSTSCSTTVGPQPPVVNPATISQMNAGNHCSKEGDVFKVDKGKWTATINFSLSEVKEEASFEIWTTGSSSSPVSGVSVYPSYDSDAVEGKDFVIGISSSAINSITESTQWKITPNDEELVKSKTFTVDVAFLNSVIELDKTETFELNHCEVSETGILIDNSRDIGADNVTFTFTLDPWINNVTVNDLEVVGSDGSTPVASLGLDNTTFTATILNTDVASVVAEQEITIKKAATSQLGDEIEAKTLSIAQEQFIDLTNATPVANTGVTISGDNTITYKPVLNSNDDGKFTLTASKAFTASANNWKFTVNGSTDTSITAAMSGNTITVTIPRNHTLLSDVTFKVECIDGSKPVNDWDGTFTKQSAKTTVVTQSSSPTITTSPTTSIELGYIRFYDDNGSELQTLPNTFSFAVYSGASPLPSRDNLIEVINTHQANKGFKIQIKADQAVGTTMNGNLKVKLTWDSTPLEDEFSFTINLADITLTSPTPVDNTGVKYESNAIKYTPILGNAAAGQLKLSSPRPIIASTSGLTWKVYLNNVEETGGNSITAGLDPNDSTKVLITIPRAHDLIDNATIKVECSGAIDTINPWEGQIYKYSAQAALVSQTYIPELDDSPTENVELGYVKLYDVNGDEVTTTPASFTLEVYKNETHQTALDGLVEVGSYVAGSGFKIQIKADQIVGTTMNGNFTVKMQWGSFTIDDTLLFAIDLSDITFNATPTIVSATGTKWEYNALTYKPFPGNDVVGKFQITASRPIIAAAGNSLTWKVTLNNKVESGDYAITAELDSTDTSNKTVLVSIPRKHPMFGGIGVYQTLKIECSGAIDNITPWECNMNKMSSAQYSHSFVDPRAILSSTTSTTQDIGYFKFVDDFGDYVTQASGLGTCSFQVYYNGETSVRVTSLDSLFTLDPTYDATKGFKIVTKDGVSMPNDLNNGNYRVVESASVATNPVYTSQYITFDISLATQTISKADDSVNISYINNNVISLQYADQATTGIKVSLSTTPVNTPSFQVKLDGSPVMGTSQTGSGSEYQISLPADCVTTTSQTIEIVDTASPSSTFSWSGTILASAAQKLRIEQVTPKYDTVNVIDGSTSEITDFASFVIKDGDDYVDDTSSGTVTTKIEKDSTSLNQPKYLCYTNEDLTPVVPSADHKWTLSLAAKDKISALNNGKYRVTITYTPSVGTAREATFTFTVAGAANATMEALTEDTVHCTVTTSPTPTVTFNQDGWTGEESAKFYIKMPYAPANFDLSNIEIVSSRWKYTTMGQNFTITKMEDNVTFCIETTAKSYGEVEAWVAYYTGEDRGLMIQGKSDYQYLITPFTIMIALNPSQ